MTTRLLIDRAQDRGMRMAERRDSNSGNEIEIAAAIGTVEPRALGARNFQPDRRIGSLRQMAREKTFEITHFGFEMKSKNAPPPCGHISGGDCIDPGSHTYVTPAPASASR